MIVDPVKFARQKIGFERWRDGKTIDGLHKYAVGIITAVTGFGKTFILITAIKDMNENHPDRKAIVVVPTTKLYQDWVGYMNSDKHKVVGHIEKHNLQNVKVFVVNTYVKYVDWSCDLLGLDECHHYANEDSQYFSTILERTKFRFLMGLSATLSKRQEQFFLRYGIPVVDVIDEVEAQKNGYIAPSSVYNLGIKLSEDDKKFNDDINTKFKNYFSFFNHEFDLVKACNTRRGVPVTVRLKDGKSLGKKTSDEWIREWARINNYTGDPKHPYSPEHIARNAAQCMNIIAKRKHKWQNFPSKLDIAVKLINRFKVQTICFSETSDFADRLASKLPGIALAYHTNLTTIAVLGTEVHEIEDAKDKEHYKSMGYQILGNTKRKKLAITRFIDPTDPVRVLSTVKALDEGVDIPSIEMAIQLAYTSTTRQNTQRNGRASRLDYSNNEKKAIIVNLFMEGTQEERWLREKQKSGGVVINWVSSVEDINPNRVISLSKNEQQGEIEIEESAIESSISRDNSTGEIRES